MHEAVSDMLSWVSKRCGEFSSIDEAYNAWRQSYPYSVSEADTEEALRALMMYHDIPLGPEEKKEALKAAMSTGR